jgi:hypothetical protein
MQAMTTNPIWIPEEAMALGEFTCVGACGRTLPIRKFPTPSGVPGGHARIIECRECRDARHPNKGGNGAPPPWEARAAAAGPAPEPAPAAPPPAAAPASEVPKGEAGPATVVALRFRDPVVAHLWLARSQAAGVVADGADLVRIVDDAVIDDLLDGVVLYEAALPVGA